MNEDFNIEPTQMKNKKVKIDPERDRENWPIIFIEPEKDKPNYEFLAVHGTLQNGQAFDHELQVMRGVEVAVPPSIVNMLRDAVSAHYHQREDPVTRRNELIRQDRSSIPWRLVKGGKYIK